MRSTGERLRRFVPVLLLATLSLTRIAIGSEPRSSTGGDKIGDTKPDCRLKVHVSWGHESAPGTRFLIRLMTANGSIENLAAEGLENDEVVQAGVAGFHAGGGDVDGVQFTLRFPARQVVDIPDLHTIWKQLVANSEADTARRLRLDPGNRPDGRKLTVLMNQEGTRGFSVTIDQLLESKVIWMPDLDVFLSAGQSPVAYSDHRKALARWSGHRILDQVKEGNEASYEDFTRRWEDMGNPDYRNPAERPPGHIVCLTWDSQVRKFGIDRGAGVHGDLGNPDHFHCWFDFGR